jgi:hypothetical protein
LRTPRSAFAPPGRGTEYHNPYDKGIWRNVLELWCLPTIAQPHR